MDAIEVLKIAEADLRRRLKEMSPKLDAQIEETLKICEQRLAQAGEPTRSDRAKNVDWDAEFNFWHKIVTGEVERTRFNDGFEPIEVDLYETGETRGWAFTGKTQVRRVAFRATGTWNYDSQGRKVLRVRIIKAPARLSSPKS